MVHPVVHGHSVKVQRHPQNGNLRVGISYWPTEGHGYWVGAKDASASKKNIMKAKDKRDESYCSSQIIS